MKPLSAEDCINFINKSQTEIEKGEYDIQIEEDWLETLPEKIFQFLARQGTVESKKMIAASSHTPISVLEILASDLDVEIREVIAQNRSTTLKTLQSLKDDEDKNVRMWVASHHNATASLLGELAKDEHSHVRACAAGNPKTPQNILEVLARDSECRGMIATNPSTPVSILKLLSQDSDPSIREMIAGNPGTPTSILDALSKDPYYRSSYDNYYYPIQKAIARNPSTPSTTLSNMLDGCPQEIRHDIITNPNTPTSALKEKEWDHNVKRELEKRGVKLKSNSGDGGCFIATAVYESPLAHNVIFLKEFRDKVLLRSFWGDKCVKLYYHISPPIAMCISKHTALKKIMRYVLIEPFVWFIKKTMDIKENTS